MRYPCYNRKKQLFGAGTYKESAVSAVLYGLAAGGIYLKQVNWKRCYVTVILVGINIAIYILGIAAFDEVIYDRGSLNAQSVLAKKELYRMVSCMFLHAGIDHLVGNMIFLAALGEMLEPKIGHLSFGILYIISGIGSSIASLIYRILTMQFYNSVGASGAINGADWGIVVSGGAAQWILWKHFAAADCACDCLYGLFWFTVNCNG